MTWKARFKFRILRPLGVLCLDVAVWDKPAIPPSLSALGLCTTLGGDMHACGHSNPQSKFQVHSPPSQMATLRPTIKPTSCAPQKHSSPPPRGKSMRTPEAGSGLLKLEIPGSQIPKELSRSGGGRPQVVMKTPGGCEDTLQQGVRRAEPEKSQLKYRAQCRGCFYPAQ